MTCDLGPETCDLFFSVRDTGIGISAKALARLFQPFTQADGSMTRKYGGTGLGLVIAQQLVHLMHGEIGVDSAPGKGSTFWFSVHLESRPAALMTGQLQTNPGYGAATARPQAARPQLHLSVLLAEDNPVNQEVARGMLEYIGCQVDIANNGQEALTALDKQQYDLVLMDCQMPELDGFAATARSGRVNSTTLVRIFRLSHSPPMQ